MIAMLSHKAQPLIRKHQSLRPILVFGILLSIISGSIASFEPKSTLTYKDDNLVGTMMEDHQKVGIDKGMHTATTKSTTSTTVETDEQVAFSNEHREVLRSSTGSNDNQEERGLQRCSTCRAINQENPFCPYGSVADISKFDTYYKHYTPDETCVYACCAFTIQDCCTSTGGSSPSYTYPAPSFFQYPTPTYSSNQDPTYNSNDAWPTYSSNEDPTYSSNDAWPTYSSNEDPTYSSNDAWPTYSSNDAWPTYGSNQDPTYNSYDAWPTYSSNDAWPTYGDYSLFSNSTNTTKNNATITNSTLTNTTNSTALDSNMTDDKSKEKSTSQQSGSSAPSSTFLAGGILVVVSLIFF